MYKKYLEIENHYRDKYINKFLSIFPELRNEIYIIEEKYDGANISLIFDPKSDEDYQIASRNQLLKKTDKFNDVFSVVKKYPAILEYGKKVAQSWDSEIIFFCELYGNGIQKRIDYGPDKYISIFDIYIEKKGKYLAPVNLYENEILNPYIVKQFVIVNGLENALAYETESFKNGDIEGYVIKPYLNVYDNNGDVFYIKKKSEKFKEKEKKRKKEKKEVIYSKDVQYYAEIFSEYINENRVLSTFSKEGEIENPKDIGRYIKLILEDAKKDFFKETELEDTRFEKKEWQYIFNRSKHIVRILNEYL